ncbi:MAG TPA: hypothetical protein VGR91_18265 [Stellaceae bacterium]|nr:hypothetical protein [Stellaceae bacterium]
MPAMWFGRSLGQREQSEVTPGNRYRCRLGRGLVATATVMELQPDHAAIPHVRFLLTIESSAGKCLQRGPRLLALRSFLTAYPERAALVNES